MEKMRMGEMVEGEGRGSGEGKKGEWEIGRIGGH